MALDICVNEINYPHNSIIIAQCFDEDFDFIYDKVNHHEDFPILKRCFKDYYNDALVNVADLNAFQAEVKLFSKRHLPVNENFDNLFEQLRKVIDMAIELQRAIEFEAD